MNELVKQLIKNQSELTRLKSISSSKPHHGKYNDRIVIEGMNEAVCNRKGTCLQVRGSPQ